MLFARLGDWHIFLNVPPEGGIGEGAPSQTEERDRRHDVGGYTRLARSFTRGAVTVGVDYQLTDASYDRYYTTRRTRDSLFEQFNAGVISAAPMIDARFDVNPALSLGAGGRVDVLAYRTTPAGSDRQTAARTVASPKLSALLRLSPAWSAYAAFNGGFRAADGVATDPTLAPSREWASEVGARVAHAGLEGSVALFNVDVRDEQTIDPVTLAASANGSSRRRGVEADARVGVGAGAALFTHATFNDAKYTRLLTDDGDDLSGTNVFGVSRATVEGGVDVDAHRIRGSLWAAYTGPFTPISEPDVRTASYVLLHLRATAQLTSRWGITAGVQNILDKRYPELRASGFVSPGQPRTFMLTIASR